ncbi:MULTISPECIES: Hpt domain-containing protein [Zhongshania]|jgi:chemosensory pili system protein ChpA (sensor histidine kinase/response regulator)|uniref:Chemotaxis protein CheA n=1 Tax=Zhongshania antarctica TaxID=641702 RepID=A0A840R2A8_9GAMM|nr:MULTISPECIES: Hpt domain-containing protein [Zhongshania]MBB5186592.1 chemosensory pili system protein ChpA (sensor histidine kinase/response regulator) [Zhongshania antarctica]
MTDRRDYIALEWVSGEIAESLGQCVLLLKDVLLTGNEAALERATAILHQVQGSLRMIEFSGPALLLEEMEGALLSLQDGSMPRSQTDIVQAVLNSARDLPTYLQRLSDSQRELPASLIIIFNDLRAATGNPLLSSSVLFNPRLALAADDGERHQQLPEATFLELAGKLLKMYQIAMAAYIRGGDDQQNLVYLGKVCGRAAKLCAGKEQKFLWLAALALIEGLANKSIARHFAIRDLMARLEIELSAFAQLGASASDRKIGRSLFKDILFYVASSNAETPYIAEVFARHNLQGVFDEQETTGAVSLAFTIETRSVVERELRSIAELLSGDANHVEISQRCKQLSDTLAVVGMIEPLYSLRAIADGLEQGLSAGGSQSLANSLRRLAERLTEKPEAEPSEPNVAPSVTDDAHAAVAKKSRAVLFDAQEAIIVYVAEQWQSSHLVSVPGQLKDLANELTAADYTDSAAILESCADYIANEIIAGQTVPQWQMLDALADSLTAVDYYLERSAKGRQYADQGLLTGAQLGVARLGYPVAGADTALSANVLNWPSQRSGGSPDVIGRHSAAKAQEAGTTLELDPDILEVFLEEAEEVLELLTETLPQWHAELGSTEHLVTVRRAFHTLKGSGRMVGAEQLGELAWSVEAMLNKVVDGRLNMDQARLVLIDQIIDLLPEMTTALAAGREISSTVVNGLMSLAKALTDSQLPRAVGAGASGDDEGLIAVFIGEADNHLRVLEAYIESVDSYPVRLTDDVQRALHTLKGSSKMAEVGPIAAIITPLEGLVKELRSMRVAAEQRLIALMSDVIREVRATIAEMASTPVADLNTADELVRRINSLAVQLIHEAEFSADRDNSGELAPGALNAFLASNSDSIQALSDLLSEPAELRAAKLIDYAPVMGVFAQRAEEINSEAIAELAQAVQVLLSHAQDPIAQNFIALLDAALDQLMEYLNQLAGEQTVLENSGLIDQIRNFEAGAKLSVVEPNASGEETLEDVSVSVAPQAASVSEPASDFESDVDPEIIEIFMEEAHDLIEGMDEAIQQFSENREDQRQLDDIQRYLHTLKGGARLSGIKKLGDLSHDFETAITTAVTKSASGSDAFFNTLQGFQDQLVKELGRIGAADAAAQNTVENELPALVSDDDVLGQVAELLPGNVTGRQVPPVESDSASGLANSGGRAPQEMIKVPSILLERLINLAGETSIARGRVEEQVSEIHYSLEEMEITVERLQEQVRRLDIETEAQIVFRQEQVESEGADGFDPLEFDRYSQLQQLSRSLLESASDLTDLRGTLVEKSRDMETLLVQQSRVNTELQEGLMRSQMVHFARMVPRLRRGVRQVASELDKPIDFKVYNAEGEMDRRVLERIIPALEHMLRNAVDHGIESPAERVAAGKNAEGEITMRFDRQGGDVVIVINDDGAGIDLAAVRTKAEALGLVSTDAELTERQLLEYIFHAGFTTASNVTQISGRGVGMDVVRSEIKQLGGAIDIQTSRGQGSRFEIRLPFTVSVNRALMVSVGGEIFAVPLNNIEGIVRVSPYELDVYYQDNGPDFEYAGQDYKLRYLGNLLGASKVPNLEGQTEPRPVLLIRNAEPATAVQVDSLLGSREVVVKTLGPQFAAVPGLSGATVLGDGSVVVILDMLASIRADTARQLLTDNTESVAQVEQSNNRLVMVVDDSVTVRKVTSRLLARQQMEVALARDGLDAMNQLQDSERLPDVILLDIEMPRMDGFEVANRVRSNPRLKHIPIIMISSRTGQKHRQRAFGLGVHNFLGKPYQEIQLLKAIDDVTSTVVAV